MRRRQRSGVASVGASIALFCLLGASWQFEPIRAQDILPTPKGQLGGAPSLQTEPAGPDAQPTPERDEDSSTDIPQPSECDVEPRSIEDLFQLAETSAGIATPMATPESSIVGTPAGDAVMSAVGATVRMLVACSNAGDGLRILALVTDDYIRRTAASGGMEAIVAVIAATPPAPLLAMPQLLNVQVLGADRAVARLKSHPDQAIFALSELPGDLVVLFVRVDDGWLIDEVDAVGSQ